LTNEKTRTIYTALTSAKKTRRANRAGLNCQGLAEVNFNIAYPTGLREFRQAKNL
jgi:hypothetical protein